MVEIANNISDGISNPLTGITINDYADALDWPCLGIPSKNIHLSNTHGANALKYKVLTYAHKNGKSYEEVSETSLVAGDLAQIILEYGYAQVKVQVKSGVADAHATYELDYTGNKR